MILNQKAGTHIGDLKDFGRTFDFKIDEEDVGGIIEILANRTYTQKELAVCREVISNSYDAHCEAGKANVPFIVTVPTALDPIFKVRDFGLGLSMDDIEKIYVRFAKSTKRQNNSTIGCYGIGAKAPFCYSDSFCVISWNNGICSKYIAQIDGEKRARMIVVSSEPSTEPSGIEIQVAVKSADANTFKYHILNVCKYLPTPPTLINVDPTEVKPILKISEGSCWYVTGEKYEYTHDRSNMVAMCGNVAYRLRLSDFRGVNWEFLPQISNIHLVFELGEVDIPPSRENLEITAKTTAAVLRVAKKMAEEFRAKVLDSVQRAENIVDACERVPTMFRNMTGLEWFGLPLKNLLSDEFWRNVCYHYLVKGYNKNGDLRKCKRRDATTLDDKLLVFIKDDTKRINQKIQKAMSEGFAKVLICDIDCFEGLRKSILLDFWPKKAVVFASQITLPPIVRAPRGTYTSAKSGNFFSIRTEETSPYRYSYRTEYKLVFPEFVGDLPAGEKVYVPIKHNKLDGSRMNICVYQSLKKRNMLPTIFGVKSGAVKKLNPHEWVSFDTWMARKADELFSVFTVEEIALSKERTDESEWYDETFAGIPECLQATQLVDAALNASRRLQSFNDFQAFASQAAIDKVLNTEASARLKALNASIFQKYPMLMFVCKSGLDSAQKSAIIQYINDRKGNK